MRFGFLLVLVCNLAFTALCVAWQDYELAFVGLVGAILSGAVVDRHRHLGFVGQRRRGVRVDGR